MEHSFSLKYYAAIKIILEKTETTQKNAYAVMLNGKPESAHE
jgi:hypothetical protein